MMIIEKLGDKLTPDTFKNGIFYRTGLFSFGGLRMGCLMIGLGVGLLVGYGIISATQYSYFDGNRPYEVTSVVYGACVLLGGGTGLVISYLIEKKQREDEHNK